MPSSDGEDKYTTAEQRTDPITDESLPGEISEHRVSSAKDLDDSRTGSGGRFHCRELDKKCSKPSFAQMRGLRRHQREVHKNSGDSKKTLLCQEPGCRKSFTRNGNLSRHFRDSHGDRLRRSACAGPLDIPDNLEAKYKQLQEDYLKMALRICCLEEQNRTLKECLAMFKKTMQQPGYHERLAPGGKILPQHKVDEHPALGEETLKRPGVRDLWGVTNTSQTSQGVRKQA
jgi:hypothetical protein